MRSEIIIFNGVTFRRYPESKRRSDRVYFTPGIADKQRGIGRLHEEMWKSAHGPIPEGHHVHHVDHDPLNNTIGNLALLADAEHRQHHGRSEEAQKRTRADEWLEHLAAIRPSAAAWHSSPEGIEWHREHGRESWNRPLAAAVCEQCGNAFVSKLPKRFCSDKCKSAWRRQSGVDDEVRNCLLCGATFTVNRYAVKNYCTRSCASKAARMKP